MIEKIFLNYFIGIFIGFFLEVIYRSIRARKFIKPKFINLQMYALTGSFLYLIYYQNISFFIKIPLIAIFTTLIEFIVGSLYLKFKNVYLWDYTDQPLNYRGIICLRFSFYWLIISLLYYYLILPLTI